MNKIAEKAVGSAGAAVRAMNPHVFGTAAAHNAPQVGHYESRQLPPSKNPLVECAKPQGKTLCEVFAAEGKRIRQGEPKLNQWETDWKLLLEASGWSHVRAQSLRVRLANGSWYKGDVSAVHKGTGRIHVWEIKGNAKMKGVAKGVLALKVAAAQYQEICWTLAWKENGAWTQQEVLP